MAHRETIESIHAFIKEGRKKTDTKSGNILGTSVGIWIRYYNFLQVIRHRFAGDSGDFTADMERRLAAMKESSGSREMTPEEIQDFQRSADIQLVLHLDIESLYVFAKILLDRMADTFAYYFNIDWTDFGGQLFGSSHTRLTNQFDRICEARGLQSKSAELSGMLADLKSRIVDYRTGMIEHIFEPRIIHGTSWGGGKKAKISATVLYPVEADHEKYLQKNTEDPDELVAELDKYIGAMLRFMEANTDKSVLPSSKGEE